MISLVTTQSDPGRQNTATDWTRDFSRGWNCAGTYLVSLFSPSGVSHYVPFSVAHCVPHKYG